MKPETEAAFLSLEKWDTAVRKARVYAQHLIRETMSKTCRECPYLGDKCLAKRCPLHEIWDALAQRGEKLHRRTVSKIVREIRG